MLPGQYQARIQNMDYLGLVAGMCKELECIPWRSHCRHDHAPDVSKVYFEIAIKVAEHSGLLIYALT